MVLNKFQKKHIKTLPKRELKILSTSRFLDKKEKVFVKQELSTRRTVKKRPLKFL